MNVIITGAGFENKGAEAMLRTVQTELSKRLTDCDFFLWRPLQRDCRLALNSGFSPFQLPFEKENSFWHWPKGQRVSLLLWSLLELSRSRDPREIRAAIAPGHRMAKACGHYLNRSMVVFDVLIDISGFAYGDSWGVDSFQHVGPLMDYCVRNGKPVIFLPQAWGSFKTSQVRQALRNLLSHDNTFFYSRDKSSCHYLEQALERPLGSILVTPDIVFGFQGGTPEQGEHVLRSMGCTLSRPIIGLAPNMRVYERVSGKGMGNIYLQALVKLAEYCIYNHDVDIVLQANGVAPGGNQIDDRYLCSLVAASISNPHRCFMTRESLTAEATRALIGRFDYLIGSRFHSLVFGFSQGVPGMAISWSHKYRELFSLFGMEDKVQEYQNINPDALIETFEKGWADRQRARVSIIEKARQLRNEVSTLFDEVAEKIQGGSERNHA